MNKLIYIIVLVPFIYGCALLKGQQKNQQKISGFLSTTSKLEEIGFRKTDEVLVIKDSTNNEIWVDIAPKGMFSYSPGHGFKGEGSRVTIKGNTKAIAQAIRQKEKTDSFQFVETKSSKKKSTFNVTDKKSLAFGISSMWIVPLAAIGLLWFVCKYRPWK